MPAVFSEKVKNKLGVEVAEELLVVMQNLIVEKSVPKDELSSKLGAIEIRLISLEKNYERMEKDYAGVSAQIERVNTELTKRIDGTHERMERMEARFTERMENLEARLTERMENLEARLTERMENLEARLTEQMHGLHKLLISQTKWMMGTIFLVIGALITGFMAIFKFVG